MSRNTPDEYVKMMKILLENYQQIEQLKIVPSSTMYSPQDMEQLIRNIFSILKNNIKCDLYNVKIFDANGNIDVEEFLSLCDYAKCYNGFLLHTSFSSHYLLKNQISDSVVGSRPFLSPYFFIKMMWSLKCEDLLIESFVHIPLDICVEILELTIKHVNELQTSRARRIILLLIYKVYYKCLWLHLGTLSEKNVTTLIYQLITYFKKLCNMFVSHGLTVDLSLRKFMMLRGILMKNMLRYVRKCMHSKMESYSKNQSLAKLFTLTYGSFDECAKYYHVIPVHRVKFIVTKLDKHLVTQLLELVKNVDQSELRTWKTIYDDENAMISLQRAIIMECHHFIKFMQQDEFLMTNKDLFHHLKKFVSLRKSKNLTFTLKELYRDITHGSRHGMHELNKRYKEWDLSTLDFIMKRKNILNTDDYYTILKYLHHICTHAYSKAEKYRVYIAVFKILIQLKVYDLYLITLKYINKHFDDKHLEDFYDEACFGAFLQQNSFSEQKNLKHVTTIEQPSYGILLIFILLNPKRALSQLILHEIDIDTESIMFQHNMLASIVQNYYKSGHRNILTYILQDIILQQRVTISMKFRTFIDDVREHKMITANDLMNYLYIPYLHSSYLDLFSLHNVLFHIMYLLDQKHCSLQTNFQALILALTKIASLMRRCNRDFSKFTLHIRIQVIGDIISHLREMQVLTADQLATLSTAYVFWDRVEPFELKMLCPMMSTFDIIQIYEKRCFITHQRLRTNPRCHPKLRNYVQSFHLDQEAFIRYVMLHCFDGECANHARDLTFIWCYNFGWTNHMMAYENMMRIIVDVVDIILKYSNMFPKHTFVILLFALVQFCTYVKEKLIPEYSFDTIRSIMLNTMSSIKHMASRTHYAEFYDILLQKIQIVNPQLRGKKYFRRIYRLIDTYAEICNSEATPIPILNKDCTCEESSYCKFYAIVIDKKITANYQTYLFIRECINHARTHNYSERLLRALCSTE